MAEEVKKRGGVMAWRNIAEIVKYISKASVSVTATVNLAPKAAAYRAYHALSNEAVRVAIRQRMALIIARHKAGGVKLALNHLIIALSPSRIIA